MPGYPGTKTRKRLNRLAKAALFLYLSQCWLCSPGIFLQSLKQRQNFISCAISYLAFLFHIVDYLLLILQVQITTKIDILPRSSVVNALWIQRIAIKLQPSILLSFLYPTHPRVTLERVPGQLDAQMWRIYDRS